VVSLPALNNPDGCGKIRIEPSYLNSFIRYSQPLNQLNINPTLPFQLGEFTVSIILSDDFGLNKPYLFTLIVYDYPRFSSALKTQVIKMNSISTYDLPIIEEFTPITIIFYTSLPEFTNFAYPTFTFTPIKKIHEAEFVI
jgi:hypothetical protein